MTASKIDVLCEDQLQKACICRFMKKRYNLKHDTDFTVVPIPKGKQSGVQHVMDGYGKYLKACRRRHAQTALIVITDADSKCVGERNRDLDRSAEKANVRARAEDENIAHIIPKWHIQTWLAFLDGGAEVDENDKKTYKTAYAFSGRETEAHSLVDKLVTLCEGNQATANMPDSLKKACDEISRIGNVL